MEFGIIFITLFVLILFGVPIAYSIGLSTAVFLTVTHMKPLVILSQRLRDHMTVGFTIALDLQCNAVLLHLSLIHI